MISYFLYYSTFPSSPVKEAGGTLQEFMKSRHGNGVVTVDFCSKAVQPNLLQQDEVPLPPHQLHPSWFSPTNLLAKGPLPRGEGVVRSDREWGDGNNQTQYAR